MSDVEKRFHETWLGMVQPSEGLVVSVPVLVDAQCVQRQPPEVQHTLLELCPPSEQASGGARRLGIRDLGAFFEDLLGLGPDRFDGPEALPPELCLVVPEGRQTIRPTLALKKLEAEEATKDDLAESTASSRAGQRYLALVWDVAAAADDERAAIGLDLDRAETVTGPWEYPASAKLDRLLRHCRVPIGILTNRQVVRLVYAPRGESSGHLSFRLDDMATVGGRPILDGFVMLLSAARFFGVAEEQSLPALLRESRKRQANVTSDLAEQVFEALQILLRGFEAAAERDGRDLLDDALAREGDHLYKGLLTVLLRLVVLLYAEDRGLMPTDHPVYAEHLSVLALFDRLQRDRGTHPDSMCRRFGAWGQLLALFRAVFVGAHHGGLRMPPRRGALFDPNRYPFIEGWGPAGSAPIAAAERRAEVKVPTVDDETVHRVLERLVVFEGQRLSYRTLDVEQIGSVYEALMGYHVLRLPARAVCLRPNRVWLSAEELMAVPPAHRAKWLKETVGLTKAQAEKIAEGLEGAETTEAVIARLGEHSTSGRRKNRSLVTAEQGRLVLQPGAERRRTSSHYTPRSLSAPIVRRTLEPLLARLGQEPTSDRILGLKICDPAMGSGAFLVEACRFLADRVVAAWTREGKLALAADEDPVLRARRLVAERCLYGVDKNDAAVELAKLSLWLVTLAKDRPFTFVDHALRHGDSLVGLDLDQIRAFHWKSGEQVPLAAGVLGEALAEAIAVRRRLAELAADPRPAAQRDKERLLADAADACDRARLLGDVIVGAFFAESTEKAREKERLRRLALAERWLGGDAAAEAELRELQREIRARVPVFHWMLEYPEVFFEERPDPFDSARGSRATHLDAIVGNPPFLGGKRISTEHGDRYAEWLGALHRASKNADLAAHFFRRADGLLGSCGTTGLVATNTIAEGDTRRDGLRFLVSESQQLIYEARRSQPWPGQAAVHIAVVHLAKGLPRSSRRPRLDGRAVAHINSMLRAMQERQDAVPLAASAGVCFIGCFLRGRGFVLEPSEAAALLRDERNAQCVRPFLGGEEVNGSPVQAFGRYVIDFGSLPLGEARAWPDLLALVSQRVRPERDKLKDRGIDLAHKRRWWQFANPRPELRAALSGLGRCIVAPRVTKHLTFAFLPTDRVFSDQLCAFALESYASFAVLQSRAHEAWARLHSSSMGEGLRYTPTSCVETFVAPFGWDGGSAPLNEMGSRLYERRAAYMRESRQGLTRTYNKLKDPSCQDAAVLDLRGLHEQMDRAVCEAYGWSDLEVPPYCPSGPAQRRAIEAFGDELIDRLFALNAERAAEERRRGLGGSSGRTRAQQDPKLTARAERGRLPSVGLDG